ncbi:MAG: Ig-like domain-containing protein, partial [Gemmatimonadaceae bacterium]
MIIVALIAAACLDTANTALDAPHSVAAVTVQPSRATVSVGKHVALDAQITDASGSPMTGAVTWSSRDTTIATVTPNGEVTAVRIGSTQITAVSSSKEGTATVTVTPPGVASLQLTPSSATIQVHDELQLSATPRDDQGNALSGFSVSLSSSNPSVASVSPTGMV